MARNILHCDMNNFYASVECMLNPALKEYPVAVCGSVEERHGIVLAKNYKAKAFDVKTGDTVWQAQQKCRDLVIVPPHYEEYIKYSKLARSVYERYTDQVVCMSAGWILPEQVVFSALRWKLQTKSEKRLSLNLDLLSPLVFHLIRYLQNSALI